MARRYEIAAERGFFRALKELRQVEKAVKAVDAELAEEFYQETLASFSQAEQEVGGLDDLGLFEASTAMRSRFEAAMPAGFAASKGRVDVPITVGKAR